MSNPRAFSYIRFSTPEQGKGNSLARQLELAADYAKSKGLDLDETLTFRDLGVSAYKQDNLLEGAKLYEFLAAIDEGLVPAGSYLLVESLDRLTRAKVVLALQLFLRILGKGIKIVTLNDGYTYSSQDEFQQLMYSLMVFARAHEESASKGKRVAAAWSAKRQVAGDIKLTKMAPSWLTLSADRRSFLVDDGKAIVVNEIVDLALNGLGRGAIAKRLTESGVPIFPGARKGQGWYPSYVVKILRNRALVGEFQPHKQIAGKRVPDGPPLSNYYPPIVTEEKFALLQQVLDARRTGFGGRRGVQFSNLFSGLLFCSHCGGSVIHVNKGTDRRKKASKESRYLVCGNAKRGAGCYYRSWAYLEFENAFLQYVRHVDFGHLFASIDTKAESARLRDAISTTRALATEKQRQIDNLTNAIAADAGTPKAISQKILALEQEVEAHRLSLEKLELESTSLVVKEAEREASSKALRELPDKMRSLPPDELYELRARVNSHLRRSLDRIDITFGRPPRVAMDAGSLAAARSEGFPITPVDDPDFGGYGPEKNDRFLFIRTKDGKSQTLHPENAIPDAELNIRALVEIARTRQASVRADGNDI